MFEELDKLQKPIFLDSEIIEGVEILQEAIDPKEENGKSVGLNPDEHAEAYQEAFNSTCVGL